MDAEALLDTRAKDLQALTLRLSPPARPRRVIGWAIDEHLRTDLVESALSMAVVVLRVGVKTMAVSPNSPEPDHRSALVNRPSRDATSGSAIAACRVRLILPSQTSVSSRS
jgi:hypothetical protein